MIWQPTSFHIELTNMCVAECPFCPRTKNKGVKTHQELSIGDIKAFFSKDVLSHTEYILLCGSFWDPIYAKDFLEIVAYFQSHGVELSICTNGYNQKKEFWETLGRMPKISIIFWIDGITQKTHGSYRINTELKKVLINAKKYINAWGKALWQFLPFKMNQHEIERAKLLSQELGFYKFIARPSREYSKALQKPTNIPEQVKKIPQWDKIVCEFSQKKQWFINAAGYVLPCCYLGNIEKTDQTLMNPRMNIKLASLESIQQSAIWMKKIGSFHDSNHNNICKRKCSV